MARGGLVLHVHIDNHHIKDPSREPGLYWFKWPLKEYGRIYRGPVTGDRFDTGDLDGDGKTDIISGRFTPDKKEEVCWYRNPGPDALEQEITWKETVVGTHDDHIKDILARDLDADGDLDLVARGHAISSLFINTGKGWHKRVLEHPKREGLAVGDLDGDGMPDVILGHSETVGYPLSWYSVNSAKEAKTGPWIEHRITDEFKWCETIDVGDVDNDGDPDILAAKFERHGSKNGPWANFAPFPVILYLNNGDGSGWKEQNLADHGIYAGKLGDLGGDGKLDIVGPDSYFRGPIHIWINQ